MQPLYMIATDPQQRVPCLHVRNSQRKFVTATSIFTLSKIRDLDDLWIIPVGLIPQEGRRPRLIYNFIFGILIKAVRKEAPPEAVQFRGALKRLLHQIVTADPAFGTVFLSKVDMSDAYVHVSVDSSRGRAEAGVCCPSPW